MMRLKLLGQKLLVWVAQRIGPMLNDAVTGEPIGRAIVITWRGRVWIVGLEDTPVRPVFLPQERITYWRQELGFTKPPPPDFPNERNERQP